MFITLTLLHMCTGADSAEYVVYHKRIQDRGQSMQCMQWNYIMLVSRSDWPRTLPLHTNLFTAPVANSVSWTPVRHTRYHRMPLVEVFVISCRPVRRRLLMEQDAQLSQRDCAAGCVIVFPKSRRLELGDNVLRTL